MMRFEGKFSVVLNTNSHKEADRMMRDLMQRLRSGSEVISAESGGQLFGMVLRKETPQEMIDDLVRRKIVFVKEGSPEEKEMEELALKEGAKPFRGESLPGWN